jgi:hypothetical protein
MNNTLIIQTILILLLMWAVRIIAGNSCVVLVYFVVLVVTAESLTPYRKPMGINGDFSIRLQFDSYIRLDSNYLSSLHVLTRATHARSLLPAALASVPFGFCISSSLSSSSSSTASRAWRTGTNR